MSTGVAFLCVEQIIFSVRVFIHPDRPPKDSRTAWATPLTQPHIQAVSSSSHSHTHTHTHTHTHPHAHTPTHSYQHQIPSGVSDVQQCQRCLGATGVMLLFLGFVCVCVCV